MVRAVLQHAVVHVLGLFEVAQSSVNNCKVQVGLGLNFWSIKALLEHLERDLKEAKLQVGLATVQEYSRIWWHLAI